MKRPLPKYEYLDYSIESLFICEIIDFPYNDSYLNIINQIAILAIPYLNWGKN